MNADKRNEKFDELISGAVGQDRPQFDFDKWKQEHKEQSKRITAIENGYVHEKKKAWFFKKKEE